MRHTGYSTTTYRMRLYDRHFDWLLMTREIYSATVMHYYRLLLERQELLQKSNFELLRCLETLTVGTKEMKAAGKQPEYPLPTKFYIEVFHGNGKNRGNDKSCANNENYGNDKSHGNDENRGNDKSRVSNENYGNDENHVMDGNYADDWNHGNSGQPEQYFFTTEGTSIPLYFRRAAINVAVGMVRSYVTRVKQWQEKGCKSAEPAKALRCQASPLLYQGMYRNFAAHTVELKLFNGSKWTWVRYPFAGRSIPEDAELLSPLLVFRKKEAWLHIPVKTEVADIRSVRERMEKEEFFCSVAVPDGEILAAAVVLNREGKVQDCRFFHGGKERQAKREQVLRRIQKSQKSRAGSAAEKEFVKGAVAVKGLARETAKGEDAASYKKIGQINDYYAHKVSRELLDYCMEQNVRLIVVPNYAESRKKYRNPYHWQGRTILKNLKYKAFQEGILVSSVKYYGGTVKASTAKSAGNHSKDYADTTKDCSSAAKACNGTEKGYRSIAKDYSDMVKDYYDTAKSFDATTDITNKGIKTVPEKQKNIGNEAAAEAVQMGRYFLGLFSEG